VSFQAAGLDRLPRGIGGHGHRGDDARSSVGDVGGLAYGVIAIWPGFTPALMGFSGALVAIVMG
jgi:hypothetical protein